VNLVVLIQGLEEDKGASGVQVKPEFRIVNIYFWGAIEKIFSYSHPQCCGAEIICIGSGSAEMQIRIAALDPAPAQAQDSFIRYLENCLL
jgi:hypothetical protein